jgi:non-specific serine/threonine protein kinase
MRELDSDFSPDSDGLAAIAAICRRLDGIPLAIEFAATRAAALGLEQVASRLDDRLTLLTGGRRTALPRHRTLRAMLDWSYELLPEAEQRLFRGLLSRRRRSRATAPRRLSRRVSQISWRSPL